MTLKIARLCFKRIKHIKKINCFLKSFELLLLCKHHLYYHGFLKISRLNNFGVKYVYAQGIVIPMLKVPENLENL